MNWRYGKPDASIKREIVILLVLIPVCFIPLFYLIFVLRAQASTSLWYLSMFFFIIGLILIVAFSVIYERRCPKCTGYFGIETIASKKASEREVYRTKTEIKIEKIYRNTYRCVFCGYTNTLNEPEYEIVQIE